MRAEYDLLVYRKPRYERPYYLSVLRVEIGGVVLIQEIRTSLLEMEFTASYDMEAVLRRNLRISIMREIESMLFHD